MNRLVFSILLGLLSISPTMAQAPSSFTLTIQVDNAESNEGYVLFMLFQGEDGFPNSPEKALAYDGTRLSNNTATIVFKDLEPGEYAVAVLHDENSNGKMDTNMIGIPREAYGASNDAKATFGPPKFADAKFSIAGNHEMKIKLRKVFQ